MTSVVAAFGIRSAILDFLNSSAKSFIIAIVARNANDLNLYQVAARSHYGFRTDYLIGETRVVANPRGYRGEVSRFDPGLVVDI